MKFRLLLILASLTLTTPFTRADQLLGIGAQYQSITDFEDSGIGLNIRYGYAVTPQFSLQSEFSVTPAEAEQELFNSSGASVGYIALWTNTFALYGKYEQPLGETFYVHGRVGALYYETEADVCQGSCQTVTDSDSGLSYGAGAGVHLSPNLNAVADWTVIAEDAQYFGLTLEYRILAPSR
ncbi:porin family protein [Saccharospirillum mangrovi]|uniref:porin family protein n=1 Tax=Saccharospirillum mangrovi TaxID=2161747 RepID=UPI0013002628|nr:porin family protein [Saccharospirillum mangrovi]